MKTKVAEDGWSAEFIIPLRTLRYGPPPQLWGLNFARSIERKREQTYWVRWRASTTSRACRPRANCAI